MGIFKSKSHPEKKQIQSGIMMAIFKEAAIYAEKILKQGLKTLKFEIRFTKEGALTDYRAEVNDHRLVEDKAYEPSEDMLGAIEGYLQQLISYGPLRARGFIFVKDAQGTEFVWI